MNPDRPANEEHKKAFNPEKMLKVMYSTGADQLYEEETGQRAIVNGQRTPEAQKYVDSKLAPIDFENRQNWQQNADLEQKLMEATERRLKSPSDSTE